MQCSMPIAKQRLTRINSSTKEKITVQGMEIVTSTLYISVTEKSAINTIKDQADITCICQQ